MDLHNDTYDCEIITNGGTLRKIGTHGVITTTSDYQILCRNFNGKTFMRERHLHDSSKKDDKEWKKKVFGQNFENFLFEYPPKVGVFAGNFRLHSTLKMTYPVGAD
jgi:hypothetical protein